MIETSQPTAQISVAKGTPAFAPIVEEIRATKVELE